jgi:hypothetical protein
MPIPQYLYINAPSLSQATAVFYDAALTICAADGYYSDGTVVRQQVGCVLLAVQNCAPCGAPCDGELINSTLGNNIFILNVDAGGTSSDVGAIVIRFLPTAMVNGIRAVFNSVAYNKLSSENYGYLAGTAGLHTFVGPLSGDCGLGGSTYTLDEYAYDGTSYVSIGTTGTYTVGVGQVQATSSSPGWCTMVIPKLTASPSSLNVTTISPCNDSATDLEIYCPRLLAPLLVSTAFESIGDTFCDEIIDRTVYSVPVNGTPPYLGLYDLMFYDPYGQYPLDDGYYKTNYLTSPMDTIHVQNGVITGIFNNCP